MPLRIPGYTCVPMPSMASEEREAPGTNQAWRLLGWLQFCESFSHVLDHRRGLRSYSLPFYLDTPAATFAKLPKHRTVHKQVYCGMVDLGVEHANYVLTASKKFQVLSSVSFFPSQFTPNCSLLTKAASLGKAPILLKNI